MVSPADVPASRDFNGLICPAPANALSERKRQFSELSSLRRFAFRVATLHALVAEEEVRADPVEVFRLRCHSRLRVADVLPVVDLIAWDSLRMGMGKRTRRRGDYLLIL